MAEPTQRPPSRRSRVLVVDDHPVVRAVVRAACDACDALTVVREASLQDAIDASARTAPDVVAVHPPRGGPSGEDVVRRLREQRGDARIVVLLDAATASTLPWVRMRVDGIVSTRAGVHAIARAIEAVAAGERVLAADSHERAISELGALVRSARDSGGAASRPTLRERQVLRLLAEGLTIRQVASRTGLSPRTVETHVTKLYRKLDARTRVQAIASAATLGYVDVGRDGS